jgi:hypothetical protein
MKTPNLEHIRNDCPANHPDLCFITGLPCQYMQKQNCADYQNYVLKRFYTPIPYQRPKENRR